MRRIIIIAAAALSACATVSEPGIDVRTVEVPTPVPCVNEADIKAEPDLVGTLLNGDAVHDLGIVSPSALELRLWGRSLLALIVPGCTIVEQTP